MVLRIGLEHHQSHCRKQC